MARIYTKDYLVKCLSWSSMGNVMHKALLLLDIWEGNTTYLKYMDIRLKSVSVYYEPDEEIKSKKQADYEKNLYPVYCKTCSLH